jgi:4,5-DOPA dioxygenase extradiol
MKRKDFIKSVIGLSSMATLGSFKNLTTDWKEQDEQMPVLFIGHGSPMNAIEDNEFTRGWKNMLMYVPKPKAILMVSAHWETKGTFVTAMEKPQTIHDFGGFPKQLFETQYPAKGSSWLAAETKQTVLTTPIGLDEAWGLDFETFVSRGGCACGAIKLGLHAKSAISLRFGETIAKFAQKRRFNYWQWEYGA